MLCRDARRRSRGGIEYDFVGVVAPDRRRGRERSTAGASTKSIAGRLPTSTRTRAARARRRRRTARGVRVRVAPRTTELLRERAEYVPGQGVPLFELRPPVLVGTDWAVKRAFDLVVAALVLVVGLPLWLADRRSR